MIDHPLHHRVSSATTMLECAREAVKANPMNITMALNLKKATQARDDAIAAIRAAFKLAWVNPNVK